MALARRNPTAADGAASPRIHLNEGRRRARNGQHTTGSPRGCHVTMSPVRQAAQRRSHWDSGLHGQQITVQKTSPRSDEHKTGRGKRTRMKRRRCTPRAWHVKTSRRHHTTSTTRRVEDEVSEEAPSPRAGGTRADYGAARHDAHTLLKTLHTQGELVLSATRTGTAGGGSRAVPTSEDSLTVVIDTTNWARAAATVGTGTALHDERQYDARRTAAQRHRHDARRWAIDAPPATAMHAFQGARAQPHTNSTRDPRHMRHGALHFPLPTPRTTYRQRYTFFISPRLRTCTDQTDNRIFRRGRRGMGPTGARPSSSRRANWAGPSWRRPTSRATTSGAVAKEMQADTPRATTTADDSCDGRQAAAEPEAQERSRANGSL